MRKKRPTAAQRVAAHRARVVSEGGRQVAVMLNADAVAKLKRWGDAGWTQTETINRLLIRSKPS